MTRAKEAANYRFAESCKRCAYSYRDTQDKFRCKKLNEEINLGAICDYYEGGVK